MKYLVSYWNHALNKVENCVYYKEELPIEDGLLVDYKLEQEIAYRKNYDTNITLIAVSQINF